MKTVSVCIPTHNRPHFLKKAIESVFIQDFDDFDIVISDNSNNNDSRDLINSIGSKIIKYFKVSSSTSAVKNQANSLNKAGAKYLTILADDDYLDKKYLSTMIKVAEKTGAGLVRSAGYFVDIKENIVGDWGGFPKTEEYSSFVLSRLKGLIWSGISGYLFSKKCYLDTEGIVDVGFQGALYTDDYFWFSLAKRSKKVASTNRKLLYWRKHPNNVGSNIDLDDFLFNIEDYISLLLNLFDQGEDEKIREYLHNSRDELLIKYFSILVRINLEYKKTEGLVALERLDLCKKYIYFKIVEYKLRLKHINHLRSIES